MVEQPRNPRGAGRKPHQPTRASLEKVQIRAALGWSESQVAQDIGIDTKTFRKYYLKEFKAGKRKKRGEAADLLWASARAGNVSAQKAMIALFTEAPGELGKARQKIEQPADGTVAQAPARSVKLGKKVKRQMDAETAGLGTEWGTDLIPGETKPN